MVSRRMDIKWAISSLTIIPKEQKHHSIWEQYSKQDPPLRQRLALQTQQMKTHEKQYRLQHRISKATVDTNFGENADNSEIRLSLTVSTSSTLRALYLLQ